MVWKKTSFLQKRGEWIKWVYIYCKQRFGTRFDLYNHPLRGVIGVQIKWDVGVITIFNVYAPKNFEQRARVWKDLAKIEVEGHWYMIGDFNMVEAKKDS